MPAAWQPRALRWLENSSRMSWTREEVDHKLHQIMIAIHKNCSQTAANLRHSRQSGERRQHRRLLKGRQCDDGPGTGVAPAGVVDHKGVDAFHPRIFFVAIVWPRFYRPSQ